MAVYQLQGKFAIVTGAGSGINLAFTKLLLAAGCSVILTDLTLRPEAEHLVSQYPQASDKTVFVKFQQTDMSDWGQIAALWETALKTFPQIEVVVNGAGLYEPPSSTFWNAPGQSPLARDKVDQQPGIYQTFAVNTMAPNRLAQIAVDYRIQSRSVKGNLLWVASMGGYVHSMQTPLYFASKAATVSMVKSLAALKEMFRIRNAAVCSGAVATPIFHPRYCRDRCRPDDFAMSVEQCAAVMMRVAMEAQLLVGTRVPVEALCIRRRSLGARTSTLWTRS